MSGPPDPIAASAPAPAVSRETRHAAGLHVDVYGLAELAPGTTRVSMLWLHHPRGGTRASMAGTAARCVAAWQAHVGRDGAGGAWGLVAAAFDQRNHGSRVVWPQANGAWREGNETHAPDMFGIVAGTVADTSVLMDVLPAYLFPDGGVQVAHHLVLGVSLGGHSAWQLVFADPRITAAVVVVGCPDYMSIMADRARLSKRDTYGDGAASFLGSADFAPSLVQACRRLDPRAILFATDEPRWPDPAGSGWQAAMQQMLRARVAGKRVLACSGADDKLVPYRCSEPFLNFLGRAAVFWPDLGLRVLDKVYPGRGHEFSDDMAVDAVAFVVDSVADAAAAAADTPAPPPSSAPRVDDRSKM